MAEEKIFKEFRIGDIFNRIEQGRRLKQADQKSGNIPFVMAGVTDTGIANYISNPIKIFPANSITIDIFGNTFYRDYAFGAGDDTGVYWSEKNNYSPRVMMYFATAMQKTVSKRFSYGYKLRSSRSLDLKITLPINSVGEIDFEYMEKYIRAIEKKVIAGVVKYKDAVIETTKKIVEE